MYSTEKFRTDYENRLEIEVTGEYFNFGDYADVDTDFREIRGVKHRDRDLTIVKLLYNSEVKSIHMYGDKAGLFKKPIVEEYAVLLKGDLFTVHNKNTGDLVTYNIIDWTEIRSRQQEVVNLRKEANRITSEVVKKHFLY